MLAGNPNPGPPWITTPCIEPHCRAVIRYRAGDLDVECYEGPRSPRCKWHQRNRAHPIGAWPVGMPDPELPWPWKTDAERAEQARLPFWQEKFRLYPALYAKWILPNANEPYNSAPEAA